jgi:hypothetical protein
MKMVQRFLLDGIDSKGNDFAIRVGVEYTPSIRAYSAYAMTAVRNDTPVRAEKTSDFADGDFFVISSFHGGILHKRGRPKNRTGMTSRGTTDDTTIEGSFQTEQVLSILYRRLYYR